MNKSGSDTDRLATFAYRFAGDAPYEEFYRDLCDGCYWLGDDGHPRLEHVCEVKIVIADQCNISRHA